MFMEIKFQRNLKSSAEFRNRAFSPTLFLLVIGKVLFTTFPGGYDGLQKTMISSLKYLDYADVICFPSCGVMDFSQMALNLQKGVVEVARRNTKKKQGSQSD